MNKSMIVSALAFALAAFSAVTAHAANPKVGGAAMYEDKNIIENAANSKDRTTLVAAVKAAGLVSTRQRTVHSLCVHQRSVRSASEGTVETPLKRENKAQLTKLLTCHMVAADAMASTVGGCVLRAKESMGKITLTDEIGGTATVTIADVKQSNCVIHVIDKVLLPKM
ncbi:fasciclin domain-containing protein [Rhizobium leguminosarum]|uniref:fasciclin domain-containing protein n=1 Tax=Rhizobium leguminosarum TaxID=384 RepID=UPI0015D9C829|nr:fasciclin domain-containing protein [Rhizobium leguminosarum]NZD49809.1 fasciclin domain-containing protein [Rhizobium leguminosarum]